VVVAAGAEAAVAADRVGLGWRPELAAGILAHIDRIDVLEVLADDYVSARPRSQRALRTLQGQAPLSLHGVSLGMASGQPVARERLEALARLVGTVEPESWSEHLAFVRGGGREIGHLAAPPRCDESVAGAAANLARARAIVGSAPLVENVATLIDPPGSDRDEPQWLCDVLAAAPVELLLDLHNLHANAVNFGFDAHEALARLPAERIAHVHVAGGHFVTPPAGVPGAARLLDDHLHDVPAEVYALLTELGRRVPRPLTVILERDGSYPDTDLLLAQLEAARAALQRGRALRDVETAVATDVAQPTQASRGEGGCDEALLARLYSDEALVARVLADPGGVAQALALAPRETSVLLRLDRPGLALAARSFACKRARSGPGRTGRAHPAL
jgi:hypothetical protein